MSDAGKTTLTGGVDDGSTDSTYNVASEITANSFFVIGKESFTQK